MGSGIQDVGRGIHTADAKCLLVAVSSVMRACDVLCLLCEIWCVLCDR